MNTMSLSGTNIYFVLFLLDIIVTLPRKIMANIKKEVRLKHFKFLDLINLKAFFWSDLTSFSNFSSSSLTYSVVQKQQLTNPNNNT